ncbi:hypothetical protein [Novipirellula rosea]|uniref:Uncharacterized protein n=1 Tax=Novipirellula rosea TaxID=1031540 RepID=A0ABP8NCD1_9BACT
MLIDHHPKKTRDSATRHHDDTRHEPRAQADCGRVRIAGRVGEIARQVAEMAASDRLAIRLAVHRRRRQLLTEKGYSADEIDRIEDLRLGATYHVLCAMAQCSRVWIDDGTLHVDGTRAGQFAKRLSRYNTVPDGHDRSLAAVLYLRLTGGAT